LKTFLIVKDGVITNTIRSDDNFAKSIGALPMYDGAAIGKVYSPATPSQNREKTYNTQPIITWDGQLLTITQAATKWQYYAAEGSEKATELQTLIAEAKAQIREKYPDV